METQRDAHERITAAAEAVDDDMLEIVRLSVMAAETARGIKNAGVRRRCPDPAAAEKRMSELRDETGGIRRTMYDLVSDRLAVDTGPGFVGTGEPQQAPRT